MTPPSEGRRWQRTASAPPLLLRTSAGPSRWAKTLAAALNAGVTLACNAGRIAYSSASGLLALSSVALGTYAGFSAQTVSPGNTFATGTVQMSTAMGAPLGPGSFTFGTISDMLPGETIVRFLDISNDGTLAFSVSMNATATASSALNTDTTNGLQLEITQCGTSWSGTDTCTSPGGPSTVRASGPIASGSMALGTVQPTTNNVAHLQLKVLLPSSASTAPGLAGQSSTFTFTWTAQNT